MKRFALLLLAGFTLFATLSVWAGQDPPATSNLLHPSRVYGYVSLRDPSTQQLHLTTNPAAFSPRLLSVSVFFRSVGGVEQSVALSLGPLWDPTQQQVETVHPRLFRYVCTDGTATPRGIDASADAVAILYEVVLEQDTQWGAPTEHVPLGQVLPYPPMIRYNPLEWGYERVEIGQLEFSMGMAGAALSERAAPYPNFLNLQE